MYSNRNTRQPRTVTPLYHVETDCCQHITIPLKTDVEIQRNNPLTYSPEMTSLVVLSICLVSAAQCCVIGEIGGKICQLTRDKVKKKKMH